MDERNLTNLKYIDTDVYRINENPERYLKEQAEFRKFLEEKNTDLGNINFTTASKQLSNVVESSENIIDLVDSSQNILGGNVNGMLSKQDYLRSNSIRYNTENNQSDTSLSVQLQSQQAGPKDRYVQERRRYIHFDTRDRDLTLYPDQNNYRITLNRQIYTNVISVKMKGAEFINTQQLIRETPVSQRNNIIQWNVAGDFTSGSSLAVYTATLTPGNYTETTLAAEIERAMNSVQRVDGSFNFFEVSIDTLTDVVEFTSVAFSTLSDPFSVTTGSNVITVSDSGHSALPSGLLSVGDRIIIENSGSVGGIPASIINTTHVVTEIVDGNTYRFEVNGVATSDVTNGGGQSVRIGTGVDFQLLFSEPNSPATILGFDEVDTGFSFVIQNTKEVFKYGTDSDSDSDRRLSINTILPGDSATTSEIRTTLPHLLTTGDRVFIFNSDTAPTGVTPYTHEYGVNPLNSTQEEVRNLFLGLVTDPAGLIITVTGSNTFTVPIEYGNYITDQPEGSIEDYINANVDDDDEFGNVILREINAAIDLTGEKYIYMISETLGGDFVSTQDGIENVFAIIQLAGNATSSIFNSYIGGIKIFYEAPLPELREVDFQFRTHNGELFEFNDRNHSFTLEITEAIQKLEGTEYSGRIGARS